MRRQEDLTEREAEIKLRAMSPKEKEHCKGYPGWEEMSWAQRLFVAKNPPPGSQQMPQKRPQPRPLRVGDRVVMRPRSDGRESVWNKAGTRSLTNDEVAEVVNISKGQDDLTLKRVSEEGFLGEFLSTPAAGYRAVDFTLEPT
jgi:hypothetical protein